MRQLLMQGKGASNGGDGAVDSDVNFGDRSECHCGASVGASEQMWCMGG